MTHIKPPAVSNLEAIEALRVIPTAEVTTVANTEQEESDAVASLSARVLQLELQMQKLLEVADNKGRDYTKAKWYAMRNAEKARQKRGGAITGQSLVYDPSWNKYENFIEDMGYANEGQSLVQIFKHLEWAKNNCIWRNKGDRKMDGAEQVRLFIAKRRKANEYNDIEEGHVRSQAYYEGETDLTQEEIDCLTTIGVNL